LFVFGLVVSAAVCNHVKLLGERRQLRFQNDPSHTTHAQNIRLALSHLHVVQSNSLAYGNCFDLGAPQALALASARWNREKENECKQDGFCFVSPNRFMFLPPRAYLKLPIASHRPAL